MSLRLRLLLAVGLASTLLWALAAAWMWRDLDCALQHTLDQRLAMSARMVSGLLAQSRAANASVQLAGNALTVPGSAGIACQIRSLRGEVIATTAGPNPFTGMQPEGYRTRDIDGRQWRSFTLHANGFDITTADRMDERQALRSQMALAAGVPFLLAALGGLLALWFGTGRALAPLARIRRLLAARDADATEPLDDRGVPAELRPLLAGMNQHLRRTSDAIQREQGFTSDAAHELRTPLTAIDTHLQLARLQADAGTRPALDEARAGVRRLHATLEQLLLLARVEGRQSFDGDAAIDVAQLLDQASASLAPAQLPRLQVQVDAGVLHAQPAVPAALTVLALRNLLDNALRYSGDAAPVQLQVQREGSRLRFIVDDAGPGLPPELRQQATRRFWRGETGDGSGLGLALVAAIAQRYDGRLALADALQPPGTRALLELPCIAVTPPLA